MTIDLSRARTAATDLDADDPLAAIRAEFHIPRHGDDDQIYLVGHSLGAQPRRASRYVTEEMARWADLGVAGHFNGEHGWVAYHERLAHQMAAIVGCRPEEVVVMNSLTVNLHLLMVSFFEPTPTRHKVLIEAHVFPSDHFAVELQIRQRGLDPATSLVVMSPRDGEELLRTEDILATIANHGDELALVLLPGIQCFTGQVLPMAAITETAHGVGARVGFDLAHAAGNVELALHDWDVDFAAWCTYKYLNSGPGGLGGAFVHERHIADPSLPKLHGWWGTRKDTRFAMETRFEPIPTVESWQVCNAPALLMATLQASLDVIDEAGGIGAMRLKAERQIAFLDELLAVHLAPRIECVTPQPIDERGCQFALRVTDPDLTSRMVYEELKARGVACDYREPDVIRVAPVPLYTRFIDLVNFVAILDRVLSDFGDQR